MTSGAIFFSIILGTALVAFKVGQYKLFEKAGVAGWKALVPVYNYIEWMRLIGKPWWWALLIYVPVVGILVLVSVIIDLVRAYGKYALGEHAASLLLPFYYFPRLGFDPKVQYLGPPDTHKNLPKKSNAREWGDAILFAGVAALIIRTFFIEAFMIPTSSMERTLMAGDFLFVSKFHYGVRMPMVPLAIPFIHNKIAFDNGKVAVPSYIDAIQFPYFRLPGLTRIRRNDIVVFNYPAHDIHDLRDGAGKVKATSMKENYIKRCVAVPGDTLQVINQQVYINGAPGYNPPDMQYQYVVSASSGFSKTRLNKLGFRTSENSPNLNWGPIDNNNQRFYFFMPDSIARIMRASQGVTAVDTVYQQAGDADPRMYPQHNNSRNQLFAFNPDNYGPIVIPRKGMTIPLTPQNISMYFRPITAYEGHDLEEKNGVYLIDGKQAESYTFELDYYFMMGDNRHNSEDSRFWGFVPETHVVGRPLFVFFSYEKDFGARISRIGTHHVH